MKQLPFVLVGVAFVSMIGGCETLDRMNADMAARQQAADQATCQGYGYQPGTDKFADCMMKTAQRRQMQQAMAQQQAAQDRQRDADRRAKQDAANAAADAQHQADIQSMMNSDQGFTPPQPDISTPKVDTSNCTTTTTVSQGDNAGSSSSTTECH